MKAADILRAFHGSSCAFIWMEGEADTGLKAELQGWTNPTPIFEHLASRLPVRDFLEVGSWKGVSAYKAAQAFPDLESITCVDTWLGAAEHWIEPERDGHDLHRGLDGQPRIYDVFRANMRRAGLCHLVAPIRLPSTIAAEVAAARGLMWDIAYIDGSHTATDVTADCLAWWPLVRHALVGDDWSDDRFGVAEGVLDFMHAHGIPARRLQATAGFWVIVKE